MNLRLVVIVLGVIFGLVLQATIFAGLNLFGLGLVPDLVLIIVVSYGLLKGPWYGAVLGLTAGLVSDLYAGGVMGIGALAKMATGFAAGLLEKTIFKDNLLVPFLSLLAGTIVSEGIFLMVAGAFGWRFGSFFPIVLRLLALSLLNAFLAPPVYHQFYKLEAHIAASP